jgi:PHD/YefM family antitoxin component YafN of YafNO toxin-antitoxin module
MSLARTASILSGDTRYGISTKDLNMVRTISARDATANFADILGSISESNETIVVEDAGKPVAVIISPEDYREQAWQRFWSAVDRIQERNADKDPDEVYRDVTEVVEEVRQEHYERELAAAEHRRRHESVR